MLENPNKEIMEGVEWIREISTKITIEKVISSNTSPTNKHKLEEELVKLGELFKKGELGKNKLYNRDIIQSIYTKVTPNEEASVLIKMFPQKKQQLLIQYLKNSYNSEVVEEVIKALNQQKGGHVLIIQKDNESIVKKNLKERSAILQNAWDFALKSSKHYGHIALTKFLNNDEINIIDEIFALNIVTHTNDIMEMYKRDSEYYVKLNLDICAERIFTIEEKNNIVFWLRWNSWRKFEKVIQNNTDLENNPYEWDTIYGVYWRHVNQKEPRFEEIYDSRWN
tara:strand:- start:1060 stop:1902 length:843 start_codon:yes stop_codon:yes gene_type:complete